MIPFCSIETHGTTHKGQTTVNYLDMGQKIDRTIKNDTSRLVSKMINHVYLIYHGEISSTQIASFLHLVVIKINRLYTFFREKCEKNTTRRYDFLLQYYSHELTRYDLYSNVILISTLML